MSMSLFRKCTVYIYLAISMILHCLVSHSITFVLWNDYFVTRTIMEVWLFFVSRGFSYCVCVTPVLPWLIGNFTFNSLWPFYLHDGYRYHVLISTGHEVALYFTYITSLENHITRVYKQTKNRGRDVNYKNFYELKEKNRIVIDL